MVREKERFVGEWKKGRRNGLVGEVFTANLMQ